MLSPISSLKVASCINSGDSKFGVGAIKSVNSSSAILFKLILGVLNLNWSLGNESAVNNLDSGPFVFGGFCGCAGVSNCVCVVAVLITGVSGFCSKITSLLLLGRRAFSLSLPSQVSLPNLTLPKSLNSEVRASKYSLFGPNMSASHSPSPEVSELESFCTSVVNELGKLSISSTLHGEES